VVEKGEKKNEKLAVSCATPATPPPAAAAADEMGIKVSAGGSIFRLPSFGFRGYCLSEANRLMGSASVRAGGVCRV